MSEHLPRLARAVKYAVDILRIVAGHPDITYNALYKESSFQSKKTYASYLGDLTSWRMITAERKESDHAGVRYTMHYKITGLGAEWLEAMQVVMVYYEN